MTNSTSPISGRIFIRKLANEHSALVGILHFDESFVPEEGVAYLATMFDGELHVYSDKLDAGIDESIAGYGVQALMMSRTWKVTSVPDSTVVRFLGAFPEQNCWTVIGATKQPLGLPNSYDKAGHAWFDVERGSMEDVKINVEARGLQMSQMLTNHAVWPDSNGVMHTLPTIETSYRQAYHDHSLILAQFGAGEIDKETVRTLMNEDPKVFKIRTGSIDEEYCKYLASLRDAGDLKIAAPIAASEIPAQEAASHKAYTASLDDNRSAAASRKTARP